MGNHAIIVNEYKEGSSAILCRNGIILSRSPN